MNVYRILCALIFLSPFFLDAQTLQGKIFDENGKAIQSATVRLLDSDSTFVQGAWTDSVGAFRFREVHEQKYLIKVSAIGFLTKVFLIDRDSSQSIGTFILPSTTAELQEVSVRAPSFVRSDDCIIIHPDSKQIKHSHTGYDLLYSLMIPGVEVDRLTGMVTTVGGNVKVYIDGREVDSHEVRAIEPSKIEKIEYFDAPTGKYAGDVVSINFVMKTVNRGGYAYVDVMHKIGYKCGDCNGVAKLATQKTIYTLFAGCSYEEDDKTRNNICESFFFPNYQKDRNSSTIENRKKNNGEYAQFNISNNNSKHLIVGKISLAHNETPKDYKKKLLEYSDGGNVTSVTNSSFSGLTPAAVFYGRFCITDKQFLEMTLSGLFTHNSYVYDYQENIFAKSNQSKEDFYDFNTLLVYGIQMKHRNSLSIKLAHRQVISSANYEYNYLLWSHLWQGESLAFIEYSQSLGKKLSLSLSPGVSVLQYRLHGFEYSKYVSPRLQSRIKFRLTPNRQLQLMLSVGNNNPQIQNLNDASLCVDSLQVKRGNPKQKVARFVTAMLMYGVQVKNFNVMTSVNYQGGNGLLTRDYYVEADRLIQGYRTDVKAHLTESVLSVSYRMNENLRLRVDGMHSFVKLYGGVAENFSRFSARLQLDYYWKSLMFAMYGKTSLKELNSELVYTYTPANYGCFCRWSNAKWMIEGGIDNPFLCINKKTSTDRDVYNFRNVEKKRSAQNTGYIKISYNFDFGKKTKHETRDVNSAIRSAIMKAE